MHVLVRRVNRTRRLRSSLRFLAAGGRCAKSRGISCTFSPHDRPARRGASRHGLLVPFARGARIPSATSFSRGSRRSAPADGSDPVMRSHGAVPMAPGHCCGVIHVLSTAVRNWWTGERRPNRISWITALTRTLRDSYRRSCPKGPPGSEAPRSHQGPRARAGRFGRFCTRSRRRSCAVPGRARRDATGIPVSVLSSGPQKPAGHRPSTPGRVLAARFPEQPQAVPGLYAA